MMYNLIDVIKGGFVTLAINLTPRLVELTYEAALKSYWRRKALIKFLRSSHISESFISSWTNDESKRILLDRLFEKLLDTEKGRGAILNMSRSLSEKTTFPDLRNWEDSEEKIQDAHKAVNELRMYLKQLDNKAKEESEKVKNRKLGFEKKERFNRAETDKLNLKLKLEELYAIVGTQEGGYKFEKWFYELLTFCEITHRKPYTSNGRQIDGSLTIDGTTYLVELKFTKKQSAAQDIDSLKAKINKMADNTMGIMVSVSGYSNTAINEASGSRSTCIIIDSSHLYLFFSGAMEFTEIVSRVRRHASQTGNAYLSVNEFNG